MRSIAKLVMVATFIILCAYTQFIEAQPNLQGKLKPIILPRLVLITKFIPIDTSQPVQLVVQRDSAESCCAKRPGCCLVKGSVLVDNISGIENIADLGIQIDLQIGSSISLQEAWIEIHSTDGTLLFSTVTNCNGCGQQLGPQTSDHSTNILLKLDPAAISAAKQHYVKGNKLVIIFKTDPIYTCYLVNNKGIQ